MKIPYSILLLGPLCLYAMGFASNALVMAANNGQMPVLVPGGCSPDMFGNEADREGMQVHSCMTRETRLKGLADWIVIRHLGVASLGDFLEWVGEGSFWYALIAWLFLVLTRDRI